MKLSEIWIYPVKSLPGIKLETAFIGERGFEYDRHWMLVDEHGQFMSQRRSATMALIAVNMTDAALRFEFQGKDTLQVGLQQKETQTINVTVWQDTLKASLVSQSADEWFSDVLGVTVHLVCMPDSVTRAVDPQYALATDQTGFSDGFPFLLLSRESIEDLDRRVADHENKMEVRRFRPNLVVSGCDAYEEDNWHKIRIGSVEFRVVKPCSRCVITTVNPDTAEKAAEPLKTLGTYRKKGNQVFFGQNLIHDQTGSLSVNDALEVLG